MDFDRHKITYRPLKLRSKTPETSQQQPTPTQKKPSESRRICYDVEYSEAKWIRSSQDALMRATDEANEALKRQGFEVFLRYCFKDLMRLGMEAYDIGNSSMDSLHGFQAKMNEWSSKTRDKLKCEFGNSEENHFFALFEGLLEAVCLLPLIGRQETAKHLKNDNIEERINELEKNQQKPAMTSVLIGVKQLLHTSISETVPAQMLAHLISELYKFREQNQFHGVICVYSRVVIKALYEILHVNKEFNLELSFYRLLPCNSSGEFSRTLRMTKTERSSQIKDFAHSTRAVIIMPAPYMNFTKEEVTIDKIIFFGICESVQIHIDTVPLTITYSLPKR